MLNIAPVRPPDPVLSDETKHKLLAANLGIEREREWRWAAPVCVAFAVVVIVGLAWEWIR